MITHTCVVYPERLSRDALVRLREQFEKTFTGPVTIIDGGPRIYQCVDGKWEEIGVKADTTATDPLAFLDSARPKAKVGS